ncbi:MAG TPA: D-alanine--D-alanine ligase family protein [Candidatus Saccharimonadales bacterium]|nr:D-alanine--D-alanine ligase family protein [Candidatus Saccharimonadales bacterium]
MAKPVVAVFFGSRSTEHDVSVVTALGSVIKPLELSQKYTVVPVYISKEGRWYSDARLTDIRLYQSGDIDTFLAKERPISLLFDNGLMMVKTQGLRTQRIKLDVAFPAMHGTHGEDGELMGVFEMAGVPYVGCDLPSSAVSMDKVLAKQVAEANDIPTPRYVHFTKTQYEAGLKDYLEQINASLHYPLFVKPAHLGSSIAITRVTDQKELGNAIEVALHFDDKALVEEAVSNLIEVTLPIIGNDEPTPAFLEQPLLKSEDFFDFDTKYMQGGKKGKGGVKGGKQGAQGYSRIPADLPKELYKKAEATGLAAYKAIGCSGIARIDMLINSKSKTVYFNEVNPLPGSLYAHNWQKRGISNVELVCKLVELAQQRFAVKKHLETAFSTNYLKQF